MSDSRIDCVVIGYNDVDFDEFAARQRSTRDRWGAYHEVQTNSVSFGGRRITFMELMSRAIAGATGSDPGLNVFEAPSLAVCYLTSYLHQRGFRVELANFFNRDKAKLRELLAAGPRAVAITTTFYVEPEPVKEIVAFVRACAPEVQIIVGGPHVFNTCADYVNDAEALDYVLRSMGADIYINDSQGEKTLAEVLTELRRGAEARLGRISNLVHRGGGQSFRRTLRSVEQNDIDADAVDWRLFEPEFVAPLAYLRTARSCPFACSFCQYPILAGPHVVNDLSNVEAQLRALHEAGTTDVVFIDDTFNVPLPRFKQLLEMMIRENFGFRWVSFLRCSNVDERAMDLMAESGCAGVLLGIESGDQTVLNYMNKKVKLDRYKWGIGALNQRGIPSYASLICGFPGETARSVINTVEFIEETCPTFFNVQLYYHDKSAPIAARAEEFGLDGGGYAWRHNTMDWKEGIEWAKYMYRNIHNSLFISLYGFSLWGISYLVSKGISVEQVRAFGKATRAMLFDSLADRDVADEARLAPVIDVFRPDARPGELLAAIDAPYWRERLAGVELGLPLAKRGPQRPSDGEAATTRVLGADLAHGLEALAIRQQTTLANVVLALFEVLLFQLTKQSTITVGLQTAKATVPITSRFSEGSEFEQILAEVIASADAARDHQDCALELDGLNVKFAHTNVLGAAEFDTRDCELGLALTRDGDQLRLELRYDTGVFTSKEANGLLAHLERFSSMVASPLVA